MASPERPSIDRDDDLHSLLSSPDAPPDTSAPEDYDELCFSASFFLFGLLNNVLYVIIISAALDLVPADVPTGVILLADVAPSLVVKIGWPYLLSGPVRYRRRVLSCSSLSFVGMMVHRSPVSRR